MITFFFFAGKKTVPEVLKEFEELVQITWTAQRNCLLGMHHYNLGFVYISNSLFEGQKRSFKEVFSENSALMYG